MANTKLNEAKKKFERVTGIRPGSAPKGLITLTKEDFLVVVRKLRSLRPKIHVPGAERKKVALRDSNLISGDNVDLGACLKLIKKNGPLSRCMVESHFGWSKRKAGRVLTSLCVYGWLQPQGTGTQREYAARKGAGPKKLARR
jgi:hypothetical protein